jgi:hypothetical protein
MKNLFALVLFAIALCACSSTKEISSEETTTIKPMKIEVPEVSAEINLKKTTNDQIEINDPFGVYEGEKTIEHKTDDGTTIKSKVKTTVSIQKNAKGRTEVKTKISVKTDSIETKAKVVQKKTSTQKETKGFLDGVTDFFSSMAGFIKWLLIFGAIVCVVGIVLKVKKVI